MLQFKFNNTQEERTYISNYIEERTGEKLNENDLNAIIEDLQNEDDYLEEFTSLDEYLNDQIENI